MTNEHATGRDESGSPSSSLTRLTIGEVVKVLQPEFPELTMSSLRFLERIGLLAPERTPGGHRLYSLQDIERIRQIKRWQRARLSLAEIRERLERMAQHDPTKLAAQLLELLLQARTAEAEQLMHDAVESGMTLPVLFEYVFAPALRELGERWARGEITIGQEHEVSAAIRELVTMLTSQAPRPTITREPVVAACVEGELHELGLYMAACLLESFGYDVHYLGANTPIDDIVDAVRRWHAPLVVLAAVYPEHLPALLKTIERLDRLSPTVRPRWIVVGGHAALMQSSWPGRLPVIPLGHFPQSVEEFAQLLKT